MADYPYQHCVAIRVADPSPLWDPARKVVDVLGNEGPAAGNYVNLVFRHLDDIRAREAGARLLLELGPRPTQYVRFGGYVGALEGGANRMSCASGPDANKLMLRARVDSDTSAIASELSRSIQAWQAATADPDLTKLARRLLTTPLPRWDPRFTTACPFNPEGVPSGTPRFDRLIEATVQLASGWRDRSLRLDTSDRDVFDVLMIVLDPHLTNGEGSISTVFYDPLSTKTSQGPRPPQVALFHELVHAYYNALGAQLSLQHSGHEGTGRMYELMAVGLPPYDGRPFSENAMRDQWTWMRRKKY